MNVNCGYRRAISSDGCEEALNRLGRARRWGLFSISLMLVTALNLHEDGATVT